MVASPPVLCAQLATTKLWLSIRVHGRRSSVTALCRRTFCFRALRYVSSVCLVSTSFFSSFFLSLFRHLSEIFVYFFARQS